MCIAISAMAISLHAIETLGERESPLESSEDVSTQLCADTIQATVRVKADARRLFQALIAPEYVETWLTIPDSSGPCVVAPVASKALTAWECFTLNGEPLRIQTEFLVARRRRLSICWRLQRNARCLENRIAMRLIGDFSHTMLSICHVGFNQPDELHWHHQLWQASLSRLANLYRNKALSN